MLDRPHSGRGRGDRTDFARSVSGDREPSGASRLHGHLADLFSAVGAGDANIGLPPYDGGLFEKGGHPLLVRVRIPDAELAPLLDALSRREETGERRYINYRDLAVQHLGSVYERLLEYEPVVKPEGGIELRPNIYARKGSGSYYTHDDLVQRQGLYYFLLSQQLDL